MIVWCPENSLFKTVSASCGSPGYLISPGQNGCHFTEDMLKRIFLNENILVSNKIDNMSALVQIMAWLCPGDKRYMRR